MSRCFLAPLLATIAALVVMPAASAAAVIAGSAEDDLGGTDSPQQDIRTATLVYDTGGSLRGAVDFAQAPTYTGVAGFSVGVGKWLKKTGQCGEEADVSAFPPDPQLPEWYGALDFGREEGPDALFAAQGTTVAFEVSAREAAGRMWNCARAHSFGPADDPTTDDYKVNDATYAFSLTTQEAQQPQAGPKCTLQRYTLRRGQKARFACSNVAGRLSIRLYRDLRLKKAATKKLGGSARAGISTRGLRRGWYRVFVWSGGTVPGYGELRVR